MFPFKGWRWTSPRVGIGCLLWVLVSGCNRPESATPQATGAATAVPPKAQTIAVLVPDVQDAFTRAIKDGITAGSEEFDLKLEWMSTPGGDSSRQIELLQKAVDERVRAICLAPIDPADVTAPLEAAAESGIPIVGLRQSLDSKKVRLISFVSTDHFHLGRIVAQHVARQLERGQLLLLNGSNEESAAMRRRGFQHALATEVKQLTALEVNCQASAESALREATQKHKPVAGIVALDVPSTLAAVKFVAETDAPRARTPVYGYGAWVGMASDLQTKRLAATVLEDPYIIGYSSMMALSTYFQGGEILEYIMPEPTIVTADNIDQENVQRLLEANMVATP
jgi:ribose transport system substrate-binding protein